MFVARFYMLQFHFSSNLQYTMSSFITFVKFSEIVHKQFIGSNVTHICTSVVSWRHLLWLNRANDNDL